MLEAIASITHHQPRYAMKNLSLLEQIHNCIELLVGEQADHMKFVLLLENGKTEITSNCSESERIEILRRHLAKVG